MSQNIPDIPTSSPPVVLVHGWGGSFDATYAPYGWREAITELGRKLVRVDLPGHGPVPASHDPSAYADLAGALVDRLPSGQIDAVGFSLGGKLLIEVALRHPGKFRHLIIGGVGDNIYTPERGGEAVADALEYGVTDSTPKSIAALVEYSQASRSDALALAAVLRRPPNPLILADRLAGLEQTTTIINGDEDTIALPDAGLLAALKRGKGIRLPGINHTDLPAAGVFQSLVLQLLQS